jgi:hypothetical protein
VNHGVCCEDCAGCKRYLLGPQTAYNLLLNRILDHKAYRDRVNPQDRCIRVDYEDQLHLDVIPAVPAPGGSPTRIYIPNRTRTAWDPTGTDSKAFRHWFRAKQITEARAKAIAEKRADMEPMPDNGDPEEKTPLQRIVQLLKRRLDVYFDGDDRAPKSILLTALASMNYGRQEIAADGLISILQQLLAQSKLGEQVPKVWNPSNPGENLARHWEEDNTNYLLFLQFATDLLDGMQRLLQQRGSPASPRSFRRCSTQPTPASSSVPSRATPATSEVRGRTAGLAWHRRGRVSRSLPRLRL